MTATLLALAPIKDEIDPETVVVDGKSGMTGAGRSLKPALHAGAVLENVSPYKVGSHQHAPEMALLLGFAPTFAPHLLPLRRGLICTCYVRGIDAASARARLEAAYGEAPLVSVLPEGVAPEIGRVHKTDCAELNVFADTTTGATIVICAIDNLGKGAAGPGGAERQPRARAARDGRAADRSAERVSVTAARGFVAGGIRCGMKTEGLDLAIVRSTEPAVGAAMFTQNRVQAAPVVVSRRHLAQAQPQAIVLNSGCANAATGERGELDALATAAEAARLLELESRADPALLDRGDRGQAAARQDAARARAMAAAALSEDGRRGLPPRRS